jgi:hypothetical protein
MKPTVYAGTWNVPLGSMKEEMVLTLTFEYPIDQFAF